MSIKPPQPSSKFIPVSNLERNQKLGTYITIVENIFSTTTF